MLAMKSIRKRFSWWGRRLAGCLLFSGASVTACLGQEQPAPQARPAPQAAAAPEGADPAATHFSAADIFSPGVEVMPIDLPTALRIADAGNPTIGLARTRVEEAYQVLRQAQLLWIPNLDAGPGYLRHDGEIQNAAGIVFQTSKSNVSILGGATLSVQSGEAYFAPLIARRLAEAQAAASQAVNNNVQLDVALTYLDLLRSYAQLAVNADLLARDRDIVRQTREATKLKIAATGAEINRVETELEFRIQERVALKGQVRVASSRLARLLLLRPTVALLPGEAAVVPVTLVSDDAPADELVNVGLATRPELAEGRSLVAASETQLRKSRFAPLMPRLDVSYVAGGFGGGQDDIIHNFNGRGDGAVSATWELRNFGLGNIAANRVNRTRVTEANLHVVEVQAQVADEVNAALQIARARREALDSAQEAVRQALELYRKVYDLSIARKGADQTLHTLEPVLALQQLSQARFQYLGAVIDYDRAQFQLYTAMGRPSAAALEKACRIPVSVPVVPAPPAPPK
jgi:outer membrane protein TolC